MKPPFILGNINANENGVPLMKGLSMGAIAALVVSLAAPAVADDKAELLKRGQYLVNGPVACANCHTPRAADMSLVAGKEFSGGFKLVDPAFEAYTANITQDKDTGIGAWTDAQILTALREGRNREGKIIFPPMPVPTYNNMSDDDAKAIVAFLRTVKPIHNEVPESKYKVPQQAMPPAKGLPAPPASNKVAYGGYIVNALSHCFECHSTPDAHGVPDVGHHMGGGGFEITLAPGAVVRTPNITPDPETGIGKWSDADIKKAIIEGIRPNGVHLSPPMPYTFFKNMTDADLDAVVAYLRTIAPLKNKVERTAFQQKVFP